MCVRTYRNQLSVVTNSVKYWKNREPIRAYESPDLYPSAVLVSPTFPHSVTKCSGQFLCQFDKEFFPFFCKAMVKD